MPSLSCSLQSRSSAVMPATAAVAAAILPFVRLCVASAKANRAKSMISPPTRDHSQLAGRRCVRIPTPLVISRAPRKPKSPGGLRTPISRATVRGASISATPKPILNQPSARARSSSSMFCTLDKKLCVLKPSPRSWRQRCTDKLLSLKRPPLCLVGYIVMVVPPFLMRRYFRMALLRLRPAQQCRRGEAGADDRRARQHRPQRCLGIEARLRNIAFVPPPFLQSFPRPGERPPPPPAALLLAEREPFHDFVGETRRVLPERRYRLAAGADENVALGGFGAMENRARDRLRCVDRRRVLRLRIHVIARVLRVGRVDGAGLDEGNRYSGALLFKLHTQRVGERFDGVLRRAVDALQRKRAVRERTANINERPAAAPEMAPGLQRAVDRAPEIRLDKPAHIVDRDLEELAVDRDGGVVYPRIKAAEAVFGRARDLPHVPEFTDVGDMR